MKPNFYATCAIIAIGFIATAARAGEIPIDLSSLVNEPWTFQGPGGAGIINGSTFPTGPQSFGGLPFNISTGTNNYWNGAAAANFASGSVSLTIPVGVYGVTSVFTLLNTFWGWAGPDAYLYVTFKGSTGTTETVPLVGNVRVRDYNNDGNTNTINNTSTVQVWENGLGQRIDRQEFILPAAFASQMLDSVTITDTGNQGDGTDGSRAVLTALTVSTCGAYVAEGITISAGKIVDHPYLGLYEQEVVLTNAGASPVPGPLFFILEDLPSGVTLVNSSGAAQCLAPLGSRYVVPLPKGSSLAPNTSLPLKLRFSDPSASGITYTPLTAVGVESAP